VTVRDAATVPVPVSVAVWEVLVVSRVMVEERGPAAVGRKRTVKVQLPSSGTVRLVHPSRMTAKSLALPPLIRGVSTVREFGLRLFARVKTCVTPSEPTSILPKS
jgi:hypothetical protein